MSTANYASAYATAIAARDGQTLAALISLRSSYVNTLYASLGYHTLNTQNDLPHVSEFKRALNTVDIDGGSTAAFTLANVASKHVAVVIASCRTEMDQDGVGDIPSPRWERAHTCQLELVKSFMSWFSESNQTPSGWALPALHTICYDLKQVAIEADKELIRAREKATKLEEASRHITKAWSVCLNDRSVPAPGVPRRHMGTYYLASLVFKIYFKLQTLSLCKNIIRGIQNMSDLPPLSQFPIAHQVTYRYYLGIFAFLNERYTEAEAEFVFAFRNCHMAAVKNQERILSYLIPLRLLRGVLPSKHLLQSYPRLAALYEPFSTAYRIGDLKAYDDALLRLRGDLTRRGSFLVIERAREGCLRMLFKRVWLCTGRETRLLVSTVQRALAHVSVEIDSDEVECLLANLIYRGHLKGYISHERQTVVLAKDKPFPTLIGKSL